MVGLLNRDRANVPALDERLRGRDAYLAAALEILLRDRRRRRARAAIAHALEFETWRSLVRRQGLDRDQAIGLMTRLI